MNTDVSTQTRNYNDVTRGANLPIFHKVSDEKGEALYAHPFSVIDLLELKREATCRKVHHLLHVVLAVGRMVSMVNKEIAPMDI